MAAPPAKPILSVAAAPEVAMPDVSSDASSDQGMATLVAGLRARKLSLPDTTLLMESVVEIAEDVRSFIEELHLEDIRIVAAVRSSLEALHLEDIRMDEVVAEARALLSRVDLSVLRSAFPHATVAAGGLASIRPDVHVPAPPRVHLPSPPRIHVPAPRVPRPPRVHTARVKVAVPPQPAAPRAPQAPPPAARPRPWGRGPSPGLRPGGLAAAGS